MSDHIGTIDSKTVKSLFDEMEYYRRGLTSLREKLLRVLPEEILMYGSELWWEKSELEANNETKKGNVSKSYNNANKLIADLNKGIFQKK